MSRFFPMATRNILKNKPFPNHPQSSHSLVVTKSFSLRVDTYFFIWHRSSLVFSLFSNFMERCQKNRCYSEVQRWLKFRASLPCQGHFLCLTSVIFPRTDIVHNSWWWPQWGFQFSSSAQSRIQRCFGSLCKSVVCHFWLAWEFSDTWFKPSSYLAPLP